MDYNLSIDFSDKKTLEKYSSAFTLSDMEIFIFPDLLYPLVISNIMSPIIWEWRKDTWFKDIEKKGFNYKVNRIKQFIIQNYVFNLDLSTWGLTSKMRELERFGDFFDTDLIKKSNALFGYEGDKHYFSIDIRKHFGLDKFDSDIIPFWKTETIEAMTAFRHKTGFSSGAGECVSLSALYAAAMFVIGKIPLDKIFMIATPLHSQNFITENEGLITNNRRIVTKNMWYNGTSLSGKARRALSNEKVTIVSHISGHIHNVYNEATISKEKYELFSDKLRKFLSTELTNNVFINFLRFKSKYKTLFQYRSEFSGKQRYISLEKMFEYEHTSKYDISVEKRPFLLKEIEGDEFHLSPIHEKFMLNDIETILYSYHNKQLSEIEKKIIKSIDNEYKDIIHEMFEDIGKFILTNPELPVDNKHFEDSNQLEITSEQNRDDIVNYIRSMSSKSEMAMLALYIHRDMENIDWLPFIKASLERNPVCFTELEGKSHIEIYKRLQNMENESIYEGNRLALPDEVWNFRRGDGIEKAILFADYLNHNDNHASILLRISGENVILEYGENKFQFSSRKNIYKTIQIKGNQHIVK